MTSLRFNDKAVTHQLRFKPLHINRLQLII